jgi:hypothetical protein
MDNQKINMERWSTIKQRKRQTLKEKEKKSLVQEQ